MVAARLSTPAPTEWSAVWFVVVVAEGVRYVLKRLSKALSEGDRIYAVIRGGAGESRRAQNGITAPNQPRKRPCWRGLGQCRVVARTGPIY